MNRSQDHVFQFVLAELGTEGSIAGDGQLVLKGKYGPKHIEALLRKYISEEKGKRREKERKKRRREKKKEGGKENEERRGTRERERRRETREEEKEREVREKGR